MPIKHHLIDSGALITFFIFILYMLLGSLNQKKPFKFGHETGFIIFIGFFVSFSTWVIGLNDLNNLYKFDEEFFFYVCLPPIIFS